MPRKSKSRTGKKRSVRASSRTAGSRAGRSRKSSPGKSLTRSSGRRKVLVMPRRDKVVPIREEPSRRTRSAQANVLTDHDEIRQWAEERGARPACVRGTGAGEDVGIIRLEFAGFGDEPSLEEIDWNEWFQKFDESGLVLLVQGETAQGETSNFNKLVKRETAKDKKSARRSTRRGRGAA